MDIKNISFTNLSLHIKFCRYCRHDINWSERKTKTDYTLWNIREGSLVMEINRQKFAAHKGDVILFYPGDTYRAHADGEGCNFLVTFFALGTGSNIDLLARRNYAGIYRHGRIKKASEKFFREYTQNFQEQLSPDFQQYASFLNFVAELSPYLGEQIPFYAHAHQTPNLRIHQLLEYMNEHYPEPLSNRELAAFMDMSEKYFISFFHSHIGKSPKQYLTECRMKHALVLLSDPGNTLAVVAEQLGFTDSYAFSKAFKRYYGEAPGTLRRELPSTAAVSLRKLNCSQRTDQRME